MEDENMTGTDHSSEAAQLTENIEDPFLQGPVSFNIGGPLIDENGEVTWEKRDLVALEEMSLKKEREVLDMKRRRLEIELDKWKEELSIVLDSVDEVREKLTDGEYKKIVDQMHKIFKSLGSVE